MYHNLLCLTLENACIIRLIVDNGLMRIGGLQVSTDCREVPQLGLILRAALKIFGAEISDKRANNYDARLAD